MSSLIRTLFVLVVLGTVLVAATKFSQPIKSNLGAFLGEQTTQSKDLPKDLQNDVSKKVDDAKKQAMKTNLNDVVDAAGKGKKVISDYQNVQREIQKKIAEFFKKK